MGTFRIVDLTHPTNNKCAFDAENGLLKERFQVLHSFGDRPFPHRSPNNNRRFNRGCTFGFGAVVHFSLGVICVTDRFSLGLNVLLYLRY